MKTNKTFKTVALLTLTTASAGLMGTANAAPSIRLNGQPLATSSRPILMNGRTLVPMRDIFEALGATVNYNAYTRGITAKRGSTDVNLQIGNRTAQVDGNNSYLDQAPLVRRGVTYVPLRFVSNALGANVAWNGNTQRVSISTNGSVGGGSQVAGYRTISVPAGAVVPVTLDKTLSSATARVGDRFTATVKSERLGDSEFPAGSKVEGVVSEAQPRNGGNPGVLDLDFRNVVLPDGNRVPLRGELIALDNESVTSTSQGRIMARSNARSNSDRLKVIGIGAGAGFLLGRVLKKDGILPTILGGVGGLLYDMQKNKDKAREAVLPANTEFGVRLNSSLAYNDATGYYNERINYVNN